MAKSKINLAAQPQAIEAEQAVLGSMLISKDAVSKSLQWLPASNYFYKDAHAKIFSCMIDLFDQGDPIDAISVVDQLKKKKELKSVGGAYYITGLSESVPTTANVEHYAKIVLEKYILRNLIEVSQEVTKNAFDDSQYVGDILDDAESRIFNITEKRLRGEGFSHIDPILHRTFEELDKIASKPGSVTGVASGLMDLDDITSGFHSGELIIVAGRPGMGKTALALTMGRNAAVLDKTGIGMFSLEMSREQLAMRILAAECGVDTHRLRLRLYTEAEEQRIIDAVGALSDLSLYLDDTPLQGMMELRSKARRLHMEHNMGLLVVDYMQLIQGESRTSNRVQEMSEISRSLKGIARDLNVPVLAVSQLSRAVEMRGSAEFDSIATMR